MSKALFRGCVKLSCYEEAELGKMNRRPLDWNHLPPERRGGVRGGLIWSARSRTKKTQRRCCGVLTLGGWIIDWVSRGVLIPALDPDSGFQIFSDFMSRFVSSKKQFRNTSCYDSGPGSWSESWIFSTLAILDPDSVKSGIIIPLLVIIVQWVKVWGCGPCGRRPSCSCWWRPSRPQTL